MTSEKYFLKWMKEAGRGHIAAFLSWGSLTGYGLMTAVRLGMSTEYYFFGIGSGELLWICAGLGFAFSFLEFVYLLQPKKLDFYYSLPVRKSTIFWGRYAHGIWHFMIPLVLVMTACGLFESNLDPDFFSCSAGYTGRSILAFAAVFLIFYHLGILMISICGNILPSILGYALCLFYGHILIGDVFTAWAENDFRTYYKIPLLEKLDAILAPFSLAEQLAGSDLFDKNEVFEYAPPVLYVVSALTWIFLLLLLMGAAHKKRRTERIGRTFALLPAERAAQVLLSFLAGTWSGSLFTDLSGLAVKHPALGGVIGALVGVAATSAIHFLLGWGVGGGVSKASKGIFRRKWQLAAECAAVVLTGTVFFIGASSFDSFLPNEGEAEKIGVSIAGLGMDNECYTQVLAGDGQYETKKQLERYILSGEGKDAAAAWIASLVEKGGTVNPDGGTDAITYVTVCYHMKNGNEVYRRYLVDEEALREFAVVYDTDEYKKIAYPAGKGRWVADARFSWSDGITDTVLRLADEEKEALLDAYRKDVESMGMEDLRESLPLGFVEIASEMSSYSNRIVVYPFFSRTCGLLEEYGVQIHKRLSDYPIRSVSVAGVSVNGMGRLNSNYYEEPEEIEAWSREAVPEELDLQPILFPLDYSRRIKAEVRDDATNSITYVDCYVSDPGQSRR